MAAKRTTATKKSAPKKSAPKKPAAPAKRKTLDDSELFDETIGDFTAEAFSTSKGLRKADRILEKVLGCSTFTAGEAWMRRTVDLYRLPFQQNLDADRHALFGDAGTLLLKIAHPDTGDHLAELLKPGAMTEGAHRYVVYLLGRLGRPAHVPVASEWFQRQLVRDIARVGFPTFNAMADLFVRLQSKEVVLHLRKVLADHDAGEIGLSDRHRYPYEAALEAIQKKKPAQFGLVPVRAPE